MHQKRLFSHGLLVAWTAWPRAEPGIVRCFAIDLPDGQAFRGLGRTFIALAPDASAVVYNATGGLYLRTAGDLDAQLIPGTEPNNLAPVFSLDGQQVAYWVTGEAQLKRIAIAGGAPVTIVDRPGGPFGLSWAANDTILFGATDGIYQVPATGGTPERVIPAREGERLYGAQLLPDGESVLFSATTGEWDEAQIVVQSRGLDDRTVLVEGGNDARYVPTGHLIYALGDGLFGVAFDPDRRTVSGGAVLLVQGVRRSNASLTGAAQYSVSATGELSYVPGGASVGLRSLVWVGRDGREEPVAIEPSGYYYPRMSPDGTRVALDDYNDANDLWVWDFALETRTRLTVGEAGGEYPVWAPDGTRLAYDDRTGSIAWKAANNTGAVELLAASPGREGEWQPSPYFFTPDGTALVFASTGNRDTGTNLGMIALEGGAEPVWLLEDVFAERNAELSPDGRRMAYESNESGRFEIYVRPFPNVDDDRVQVSNAGGRRPLWSRDGRELFYLEPPAGGGPPRLMSAAVQVSEIFGVDARTPVMDWPYVQPLNLFTGRTYDVSLDGQRFLAVKDIETNDGESPSIVVVQNWFTELERLVPTE